MQKILKAQGKFAETEIDLEIVLMQIDTGIFYSLSGSARAVWRLLDLHSDKASVMAALSKEYDLSEVSSEVEIEEFLISLSEAGMIELV